MATTPAVKETVHNMLNEIGKLRLLVALDNMPIELQQVRQLLRQLEARLEK